MLYKLWPVRRKNKKGGMKIWENHGEKRVEVRVEVKKWSGLRFRSRISVARCGDDILLFFLFFFELFILR